MKNTRLFVAVLASAAVIFSGIVLMSAEATADSAYKRSRYASKLDRGVLKVQGPGYGSWGKRWVQVSSGVKTYREAATSKGPVLLYQRGRQWHAVQLRFNTGHKLNPRHFNKPVKFFRVGRYGVILQSGNKCYDYSWRQLRPMRRCR